MKSSIRINAVLNATQRCVHIIIPLILFPYLTNTLGSDSYGVFNFSLVYVNYFLLFSLLGINTYAIREGASLRNDKTKLERFCSELYTINLILCAFSLVTLFLGLMLFKKLHPYAIQIAILSLIIPLTAFGRDWINTIFEDYLYLSVRYVILQTIGLIATFILIRSNKDVDRYCIIYLLSISLGYILNYFYSRKYCDIHIVKKIEIGTHLKPLIILFLGQLAIMLYIQSDITMIGIIKDEHQVGIYSAASKIYTLIKSVINAVTVVTIPKISMLIFSNDLKGFKSLTNKIFNILVTIGLPISLGLFMLGDDILLILGDDYITGSASLKILSISLFPAIISGFFVNALLIPYKKEKQSLIITLLAASINIFLNVFTIKILGCVGAALTTLLAETLVIMLSWLILRKNINLSFAMRDILAWILGLLTTFIICYFSLRVFKLPVTRILVPFLASVVVYYCVLLLLKNQFAVSLKNEAIRMVKKRF